ncbi:MAG: AmmeMemoRadiSam system protein B [Magnetococcales bacterium]|nr:AmmeMemoRadiSam system protein B [Magnetococcales bacterium]NGZ04823.1 AmmeMemoRadiSam system protein B [Magnetococcales bacterium]
MFQFGIVQVWVAMGVLFFSWADSVQAAQESARPVLRPAAVAGSWYPGESGPLRAYLAETLARMTAPADAAVGQPVRALLVPHAGYRFSGATAAQGFYRLQGRTYRRVVVMGPSHYGAFPGMAVPETTHFVTPLGEIPLDLSAIEALLLSGDVTRIPGVDRKEHAIEMQLPWLQHLLQPGWQLVPLLVGRLDQAGSARLARALRPLLDPETLLVVSGDFTHYGPTYDYQPFAPDAQTAERIRALDLGAWELLKARDVRGLFAYKAKTNITACAFGPMAVLAHLMTPNSVAILEAYATSGPVETNGNAVSYLAARFEDPNPWSQQVSSGELNLEEMQGLHRLASQAIRIAIEQGPLAVDPAVLVKDVALTPAWQEKRGVFVTLNVRQGERLRGCIGHIDPLLPLYEAVIENGISAALRDGRFRPVTAQELAGLDLEISVLTPLRPIDAVEEFEVGRHGVVMTKSGRRAVFLPNVATEQGWNREETLQQLSLKAGLPADGWKQGARFEVFSTQRFGAPFIP